MIYTVSIKDASVRLDPLTPAQGWLLAALVRTCQVMTISLVVTCGREGHPPEDPHTRGQALDVSVHGLPPAVIARVHGYLQQMLGNAWTVLFETPIPIDPATEPQLTSIATLNKQATARHLHIQPVRGTVWPPATPPPPEVRA